MVPRLVSLQFWTLILASETYHYFDLPFCKPDYFKEKKQTFGEMLNGDHLINAPYGLEFLVEKNFTVACSKNLTEEQVSQFKNLHSS
ncbi:transmembrane 9 superfamily member 4-like isoform X2 [Humulus lupulus]|uniref:transmembrane 9 superfamily member 4-like isoform X2 n=1 Tax=Humulus lupulus TaxID=3486 RepID=UPI002B4061F0|nr:transmembrane 9 superfamily member 4-like isoform X2 [Humulus lupulus]